MKNAFRNTVFHGMLRGLPTRKKVTSLLILTAVVAVLFATPTVSFATSNLRNGSGQSHTASVTTIHSNTQPKPIIAIRMLDTMHGWALTDNSILKTADGGISWQDVTPANVSIHQIFGGDFMNAQYAWVTTIDQKNFSVGILHTTNGGRTWQYINYSIQ